MQLETQPLSILRESLHVSYSQIRSFMICPAKYAHNYILGTEPSHRPVNMVLGGAVHHSLANHYDHIMEKGTKPEEEALLSWFRDRWDEEMDRPIPVLFDEKKDEGAILDAGIDLLRTFHAKSDVPVVQAVEQPFSIDLVDPTTGEIMEPRLVGAMDLIVEEDGRPVVIEHKTAAKRYAQWQLDFEMQPAIYAHAAREIGIGEVGLRYQLLIKTKSPSLQLCNVERREKDITEALETTCDVLRAIEAGIFWRNRSWACADCPFAYLCNGGAP